MTPVLVFQDSLVKRPRRTCKSRWKTRDGRTARPIQLSVLSLVYLHPLLCPHHRSYTLCAPILHFHSPIPLPLWLSPGEMRTLNSASTSCWSSCFLLQQFALQGWIVMGVMCKQGQKKGLKLAQEIAYVRCQRGFESNCDNKFCKTGTAYKNAL